MKLSTSTYMKLMALLVGSRAHIGTMPKTMMSPGIHTFQNATQSSQPFSLPAVRSVSRGCFPESAGQIVRQPTVRKAPSVRTEARVGSWRGAGPPVLGQRLAADLRHRPALQDRRLLLHMAHDISSGWLLVWLERAERTVIEILKA